MGSTLLKTIKIYKTSQNPCGYPLYTLLTECAEKNISPIQYEYYPIKSGDIYDIMRMTCRIAANIHNGEYHWHRRWGYAGVCSKFVKHVELLLQQYTIETDQPIPEIRKYYIIFFKSTDLGVELLEKFNELPGYQVQPFFGDRALVKLSPTVHDLYIAESIRECYNSSIDVAKSKEIDKKRFYDFFLSSRCFPEDITALFKNAS